MPKKQEIKTEKNDFRQPVVAVMGHVDHGKTSFLDAIRGTKVVDKEAGGITQNTRAHEVALPNGRAITFIDTPGHEAFANMRLRGSLVTDFVLLIVAADDGIQPQTKQSIEFAKQANVPIILAINKIDIQGVNLKKIKSELSSYGVNIEEYGGDVLCFEISAKEKKGLGELLEGIELLAEMLGLQTQIPREGTIAEAFVLESSLDKKIGNVALCILKSGALRERVFGVTSNSLFKVRSYLNHNQENINSINVSQPFWVTGLRDTLKAGDTLYFVQSEAAGKLLQESIKIVSNDVQSKDGDAQTLFAEMLKKREDIKLGLDKKQLNVVVKASTQGTLEAIIEKLKSISTDEAKVNILFSTTGEVTEDDILRAKLAKGIIVTFQIPTSSKILSVAQKEKVLVRNYEVIYEMFDEVLEVLESMEEPIEEEIDVAKAKVKKVFVLSDGSYVFGSEVTSGTFVKGYRAKILRGELEIGRGKISSLKVLKNEVKEVKKSQECGIQLDNKVDGVEEGDIIIAFKVESY